MKPARYNEVALTRDLPAEKLKQGDVAVLIDYVPHPTGGEEGAVLEIFNAVGKSLAVVMVPSSAIAPLPSSAIAPLPSSAIAPLPSSAIAPLRADQVPTVRPLRAVA